MDPCTEIAAEPVPTCLLCGQAGHLWLDGLVDREFHAPGRWRIARCADVACGLAWLDPMPTEGDIGKAYQTYYTHASAPPAGASATPPSGRGGFSPRGLAVALLVAPLEAFFRLAGIGRERERMRLMYLGDRRPGRLLDVGCGNGLQLQWMQAAGWQVEGQDVDARAAGELQEKLGVPIHVGPLVDAALPAGSFDAITLGHVLEHVHDPIGLLAECCRLLAPGGVLVARTPNSASFGLEKVFGLSWPGLEPPRHLYHFRARNLAEIARRAGFSKVEAWTTAGNAELMAYRALGLAGLVGPSLGRDLKAKLFQVRAHLHWLGARDHGEEAVLFASRPE